MECEDKLPQPIRYAKKRKHSRQHAVLHKMELVRCNKVPSSIINDWFPCVVNNIDKTRPEKSDEICTTPGFQHWYYSFSWGSCLMFKFCRFSCANHTANQHTTNDTGTKINDPFLIRTEPTFKREKQIRPCSCERYSNWCPFEALNFIKRKKKKGMEQRCKRGLSRLSDFGNSRDGRKGRSLPILFFQLLALSSCPSPF